MGSQRHHPRRPYQLPRSIRHGPFPPIRGPLPRHSAIPYKPLFLEYLYTKQFPPTVLVNGAVDNVVLPVESVHTSMFELPGANPGLTEPTEVPAAGSNDNSIQGENFLLQYLKKRK
ncbi:hypothetical protein HDV00_012199 [Rhizophlyctis rosea]|nr:hypothetical protein HDV00_012199 [Rhizophlyctis rosea]